MGRPARTLVIVNPTAGGGRARRAQPQVADYLRKHGVNADFAESQSSEDISRRARAAAESGYGSIVALGGDGAFHHLVNGAFGRDVVLGLFPAGNGNDIAAGLGIPADPVAAAHAFLRFPSRPVDVLRAHFAGGANSLYLGGGGLGLDAEAARLVNGPFRHLPGAARYVAAALWALRAFRPLRLEVTFDADPAPAWRGGVMFAAVANAPAYGSGVKIAPAAEMDDGWLDVTLVGELPWTRVVDAIAPLLRTGDVRWPELQRRRARRVRLVADRPARFHGDGEVMGEAPVEIEVLPGAIQVAGRKKR